MATQETIQQLLERLNTNSKEVREQLRESRESLSNRTGTEEAIRQLDAARAQRVSTPQAGLDLLSKFVTTSPGAAFGAGILAAEVDFANFANKKIDDKLQNTEFAFENRRLLNDEARLDTALIGLESDIRNLPVLTDISQQNTESELEIARQNADTNRIFAEARRRSSTGSDDSSKNAGLSILINQLSNEVFSVARGLSDKPLTDEEATNFESLSGSLLGSIPQIGLMTGEERLLSAQQITNVYDALGDRIKTLDEQMSLNSSGVLASPRLQAQQAQLETNIRTLEVLREQIRTSLSDALLGSQ